MKVIIAGSRGITAYATAYAAIQNCPWYWEITEVVSGGASGVDESGKFWAEGIGIPVKRFPADWKKHGKAAGPIRNRQMAEYADALIAVWDGKSRGTANMIEEMKRLGKPVYVHKTPE